MSTATVRAVQQDVLRLRALHGPFPNEAAARVQAEAMGFQDTGTSSHNARVYRQGRNYISRDLDSHHGGAWKLARNPRHLGNPNQRFGTYNKDLTVRIGD